MSRVEKIVNRMQEACGAKNDSQLAKCLDISNAYITMWKKREVIPYEKCEKISVDYNVSMDWLLFGDEKKISRKQELLEAWKHKEMVDGDRMGNVALAIVKTVGAKAASSEGVAEVAIKLYTFKEAKSVDEYIIILDNIK